MSIGHKGRRKTMTTTSLILGLLAVVFVATVVVMAVIETEQESIEQRSLKN